MRQLLRFYRICAHRGDFVEATRTLFRAVSTRGYSRSFRRQVLREFLETKPVHVSSVIPLVTTYSFPATLLMKKIKNYFSKSFLDTTVFFDTTQATHKIWQMKVFFKPTDFSTNPVITQNILSKPKSNLIIWFYRLWSTLKPPVHKANQSIQIFIVTHSFSHVKDHTRLSENEFL